MASTFDMSHEAKPDRMDFGTMRWLSRPSSTGAKQLTMMEVTLAPEKGHDFHKHPDQEEVIYIAAGRVEQWVGTEKRILAAGDSAFIPAGLVHASFNAGTDEARMVVVFGPCVGDGFAAIEVAGEAPWATMRSAVAA